jgi:hypothetical protein
MWSNRSNYFEMTYPISEAMLVSSVTIFSEYDVD